MPTPVIQNFPDATLVPNGDGTYRLGVDAQIDASGLTIGTVAQGTPGASPWLVSEMSAIMPLPTTLQSAVSGNATGSNMSIVGQAVAWLQITSNPAMASGTSVNFYASENGINWFPIQAHQMGVQGNLTTYANVDGLYRLSIAGLAFLQARIGSYGVGTVTVVGYSSPVASHSTTVSGLMGGYSAQPSAVVNMSTGTNYVTGDYVGTASPLTFANMARTNGGTFYLPGATLIDYAVQSIAGELWLFDAQITPPADSAAWSISDADSAHLLAVIPFSTYYASALNSISQGHPDYVGPYKCASGDVNAYGYFVTRGSPTYTTGCLTIKLSSSQD